MKTTKHLLLMLFALSFVSTMAQNGSIIHHYFEADSCHVFDEIPLGSFLFALDVDGNGTNDIGVRSYPGGGHGYPFLEMIALDDWEIYRSFTPDSIHEQLDTVQNWNTRLKFHPVLWVPDYTAKKWFLRRQVGEYYYYAWLRADAYGELNGWAHGCFNEFGYCTIPNYPLHWGQTRLTDVEENQICPIIVHPNPTKGILTVSGSHLAEVKLYSVKGQLVATKQGNGTESLTMDISSLPSGLYFVTVTDRDGKMSVQKVVKE